MPSDLSPLDLNRPLASILQTIGVRNGAGILGGYKPFHGDDSGGLVDRYLRHQGGISVISLVEHAGDAAACYHAGLGVPRLGRWTRIPVRSFRRGIHHVY